MERRTFLKLAARFGGASLAAYALGGCRKALTAVMTPTISRGLLATHTPASASEDNPTSMPTMTLEPTVHPGIPSAGIVLVKTEDRASGVNRALEIFGSADLQGKNVLVKPNYNSSDPAPGSTDNAVLIPVIEWLHGGGVDNLTVADRSGMGDTRMVMEKKGLPALAEDYGFKQLVFDDLGPEDWIKVNFDGSYWWSGFPIARPVIEADGIVSVCCLKTHQYGGHFTMSLKNSVGMVASKVPGDSADYMLGTLHNSPRQREMIADINTAYSPDLIVLDGIDAFIDGGPHSGTIVHPGVIIVGTDRVAVDAVGVAILRYFGTTVQVRSGPIFEQAQIARAVTLGLGVDVPEKIQLITDDPESKAFAAEIQGILDLG
ncbi:MAG: DUF362 domain-containing protein [Anaerolineales bacterium]|nr:DUF362 domain-containing protein [Anaerolineales bacterium]